jgi:RNA polymerase sigma-70 factor, ECF subfamily
MTPEMGTLEARANLVSGELDLLCLTKGISQLDAKIAHIYEQLRPSVYLYLVLVTGNAAEAEEITQETFLQLYRCLLEGQSVRNVRPWVFRVAHNLAVNQAAGRKFVVSMEPEIWDKLAGLRSDPGLDPEQQVLEQEKLRRFQESFRTLPSLQQQSLLLRAEGFRYEQIAEILGTSVSNVAQSLHRGIKRLMTDRHA